ncbi:MAG: YggS family pyridoxal phosphate-dependent enzyme [Candidatus Delongbacteria bacterium]|jgi:pyridoxal phosphate enzyme (YggS family)|nr:YggS family pyridoxal phosphate-dependent enzyme [Candidatus Delongbacteria bacterium]
MIKENLKTVKDRISKACKKVGKDPSDITLVAVSKTFPVKENLYAYESGQYIFGENKIRDLVLKSELLRESEYDKVQWHMIGHLQSNKAKFVAEHVDLFHCLDSLKLAKILNKHSKKINKVLNVLIQINSSREESKSGLLPEELSDFIMSLNGLDNIQVLGLMSIGQFNKDPEDSRDDFKFMKGLFERTNQMKLPSNCEMKHLSMGMSNDFEVAIEEGADIVRVGTDIFGKRKAK